MKKIYLVSGLLLVIATCGYFIEEKLCFHRRLSMAVSSISVSDFNNWVIMANSAYSWRNPIHCYRFQHVVKEDSLIYEVYYKLNEEKFCREEFTLVNDQPISNMQLEYVRFLAQEIESFRKKANVDLVWGINCFNEQITIGFWRKGDQYLLTNNRESIGDNSFQTINNNWYLILND